MYADEYIKNPANEYSAIYLPKFRQKISDAIQQVVSQSGVDPELNREQINKYEKIEEERAKSVYRETLLILEMIFGMCAITALGAFLCWEIDDQYMNEFWMIPVIVAGLAAIIILMWKLVPNYVNQRNVSKQLANQSGTIKREEVERLEGVIKGLNEVDLMQSVVDTIPPLQPDLYMTNERSRNLKECFGYAGTDGRENESVIEMMSGDLGASPFSFERRRRMEMINQTYSNSITINWTTTEEYTDEEGKKNTREVEHTQTLDASVTRPKPVYQAEWQLNVMSDKAGSVSFFRKPPLQKGIRSLAFRNLDSEDFEKSFKVKDLEGNRVEFGVMFDNHTVNAIRDLQFDKENGFGDDFTMKKNGDVLTVKEKHLDDFTMNAFMKEEGHFSLEKIKQTFEAQSEKYFQKLYFAFAPVFAISMYQRFEPTAELVNRTADTSRPSDSEMERIINEFIGNMESICKIHSVEENELWSKVTVDIHLFDCEHCTEVFSVYGNDGEYHSIPVDYDEYTPYMKQETFIVANANLINDELAHAGILYFEKQHNYKLDKKRHILCVGAGEFNKEDERHLAELLYDHRDTHQ